jgi:hypothetical protein
VRRILSIGFFIFSFTVLCRALLLPSYPDFAVHYFGFSSFASNINPYIEKGGMFTVNVYSPFDGIFFFPFSLLPFWLSQKMWIALSITFLLLSVYLIFKIYNKKLFTSLGFFVLSLSCLYFPLRFTLGMGQVNTMILFLTVLSIYLLNQKRFAISGLSLALAFVIKFFPLIFIPYLLILKKNKAVLYSLLFFVLFTTLGFFIFSPSVNLYYFEKVLPSLLSSWKIDYYNQSISGFIGRATTDLSLGNALRILTSLLVVFISFIPIVKFRKKTVMRINLEFSLLITTTLIINNFSWQHHFVLLLFPLITILLYLVSKKMSVKYYIVLGLSYLLTTLNIVNPNAYPVILWSHVLYGAVILWGLNIKLLFLKD